MHPLSEQALGKLGNIPTSTYEVTEWSEHTSVELIPSTE
jgi:hypothetical protein